jgi:hypothetical protein
MNRVAVGFSQFALVLLLIAAVPAYVIVCVLGWL